MRKQLLAFLSMIGLAGSATPASPQVLKGSTPADTKSESTAKTSKIVQEDAASKDAAKNKVKLSSAEGGHATSDVVTEKQRKAGGEQNATSLEHKHKQTAAEKAAVSQELTRKDKWRKTQSESAAVKHDASKKVLVGLTEPQKSGQSETKIKVDKANAQMGDGSVKTASHGSGGGAGKVAVQDIVHAKSIKGEKAAAETNAASSDHIKKVKNNAAETHAAQQDANKKAAKQVDQASPK